MLHSYYFSGSNTTEKIVKAIAADLGMESALHNLTKNDTKEIQIPVAGDIVLFAAPVYAGRIPSIAIENFRKIKGEGQKCIAIVVYGNRDYDDALLELCDLLKESGFEVVAAGAFVARHCIFPKVASTRPDAEDMQKIVLFCDSVKSAIDKGFTLSINIVKGNRPYKTPGAVPLYPKTDSKKCNSCGTCARECPTGAISIENPLATDTDKRITCSRCITVCPANARYFGGLKYKAIAPLFKKKCAARREPEWFIAEG